MTQRYNYDDIIDLPHHQSETRPHMSMRDRAAQFSPFKAVSGHADAVEETVRLTERQIELDEDELAVLDRTLQKLQAHLTDKPEVEVTFFVRDEHKPGGARRTVSGVVSKIDTQRRELTLGSEIRIPLDDIVSITGDRITK